MTKNTVEVFLWFGIRQQAGCHSGNSRGMSKNRLKSADGYITRLQLAVIRAIAA